MTDQTPEAQEIDPLVAHVFEPDTAHHPPPSAYVGIGAILAVLTAIEIGLFYVENVDDWVVTVSLLVLMALKFFLVVAWFMHLRFEAPIFRRLFYGGLMLAVTVYAIVLGASHVFPFLA